MVLDLLAVVAVVLVAAFVVVGTKMSKVGRKPPKPLPIHIRRPPPPRETGWSVGTTGRVTKDWETLDKLWQNPQVETPQPQDEEGNDICPKCGTQQDIPDDDYICTGCRALM